MPQAATDGTKSLVTGRMNFWPTFGNESQLLSANSGIQSDRALENASNLLSVAHDLCRGVAALGAEEVTINTACDLRSSAQAATFLIEIAEAVIDSIGASEPVRSGEPT